MNVQATIGKAILKGRKYSPEIMTVMGIGLIGTGTFFMCKSTLKVKDILDKATVELDAIETHPTSMAYSEEDKEKETFDLKVNTAAQIAKSYVLPVSAVILGMGLMVASNRILKKRYVGAVAAYKVLEKGFDSYRERVRRDQGEDKDIEYLTGLKKNKSKKGSEETSYSKRQFTPEYETGVEGPFAMWFDALSTEYKGNDKYYNLMYLHGVENYLNKQVETKGHVFYNEALDACGFKETPEGAVMGWIKPENHITGEKIIDFGIKPYYDDSITYEANDIFLLNFNVQGIIYDLI